MVDIKKLGVSKEMEKQKEELFKALSITKIPPTQLYHNPHKNYNYWYKGAIHVHSNRGSGGHQTPEVVIRKHKEKGYKFIFLTDHNMVSSPDVPQVEGILYFRNFKSFECGRSYRHHILVLGVDHNRVLQYPIEFNRTDVDPNLDGNCGWSTRPCSNVYRRIQYYNYIAMAVLAHPHSSHTWMLGGAGWLASELLDDRHRYTGIEIFDSASAGGLAPVEEDATTGLPLPQAQPFCVDWWDEVLKKLRAVWGFAGDDCHNVENNRKSFNRGWIVVNSAKPFEDSVEMERDIIDNIKAGNFYTVVRDPDVRGLTSNDGPLDNGPQLSISVYGDTITVITNQPSKITFYVCSDAPETRDLLIPEEWGNVTQASHKSQYPEKYVRVVVDQGNFRVFSQPLYRLISGPL